MSGAFTAGTSGTIAVPANAESTVTVNGRTVGDDGTGSAYQAKPPTVRSG